MTIKKGIFFLALFFAGSTLQISLHIPSLDPEIMAQPIKINVGDFVSYNDKICIVSEEEMSLGFRVFTLYEFETGICHNHVERWKISLLEEDQIQTLSTDLFTDVTEQGMVGLEDEQDAGASTSHSAPVPAPHAPTDTVEATEEAKPTPRPSNRFLTVTEADVDDFAASTTSKRTDAQTKWSVKVFKGTANKLK